MVIIGEHTRKRSLSNIAMLLESGANIYGNDNEILKKIQQRFVEEIADVVLQYYCEDDYHYFPSDYIRTKIVPTKGANRVQVQV